MAMDGLFSGVMLVLGRVQEKISKTVGQLEVQALFVSLKSFNSGWWKIHPDAQTLKHQIAEYISAKMQWEIHYGLWFFQDLEWFLNQELLLNWSVLFQLKIDERSTIVLDIR